MTMMAMPAMMLSSRDHIWTTAPIALALAPNATNTVEKPATNSSAANTVSRLTRRLRLGIGEPLQRGAGEIDEIGRHQRQHAGRQEAQQAREQRGGEGDVGTHGRLDAPSDAPRNPSPGPARQRERT